MLELAVLLLAAVMRLLPLRLSPHGIGVDQWFWRAYIEKVRASGVCPPELPQFRLEVAQCYPPLFPWLMARAPAALFDRHASLLAVFIDLLRMGLLMSAIGWLSGSQTAMLVAGLVYAATPVLITYNMQLNPRGLAALFLDVTLMAMAMALSGRLEMVAWLVALVAACLLLMTHKMTTQLMVWVVVLGALALQDVRPLLFLVVVVLVTLACSRGFYAKIARGHWGILVFWYRNWRWSGSNPILESPIYGEPGYESPSKFYRAGLRAWVRRLQFVIGFNPWMPAVLLIGVVAWYGGGVFNKETAWVFVWLAFSFSFSLATTLIPAMRCMGQGYLYGYNGSFPAAMALGLSASELGGEPYWQVLVVLTSLAVLGALLAFFRALRASRTLRVDDSLNAAIERLTELPDGVVMCLPQHWHDVIAYRAGKPVAFGGHGYGFWLLQAVFPRMLVPLPKFISEQDVRYILLWPAYVNERFLADMPPSEIEDFGEYRLYRLAPAVPASAMDGHDC